jgi:hypothetical protein
MSPVAISGTDTPFDTPSPDVNYTALGLALGPQARAITLAAEVAAVANSHQAGFLRDELLRIAGQALLRPFGRRLS